MADFALWGCAIAESLGYPQQEFLAAFDQNVKVRNDEVLANNSVATVVLAFMEDREEWDGSPAELLRELEKLAESQRVDTKN